MQEWMKALAECKDLANLRSEIYGVFAEFGEIAHMDILTMTQPGKRQALCFFQLESAMQEQLLIANLGVTRFGDQLLFVVDLPTGQTNIVEQTGGSSRDQTSRDAILPRPGCDQNENDGDRRFWLSPARWSAALLVGARRVLDRDFGWSNKRLAR